MTIKQLFNFLWDELDIPITKTEIQEATNFIVTDLKKEIDEEIKYKQNN